VQIFCTAGTSWNCHIGHAVPFKFGDIQKYSFIIIDTLILVPSSPAIDINVEFIRRTRNG
jgi:hypothetical protein